jgi:hypothetical protein
LIVWLSERRCMGVNETRTETKPDTDAQLVAAAMPLRPPRLLLA